MNTNTKIGTNQNIRATPQEDRPADNSQADQATETEAETEGREEHEAQTRHREAHRRPREITPR
jgi:hypothetical protein